MGMEVEVEAGTEQGAEQGAGPEAGLGAQQDSGERVEGQRAESQRVDGRELEAGNANVGQCLGEGSARGASLGTEAGGIEPGPSASRRDPLPSLSHPAEPQTKAQKRGLVLPYDKKERVFVQRFPDSRAGAPINTATASIPNLDQYMAAAGNLGNPFHFDTAELLMTTGLTASGREEHLQSHLYVGKTPWDTNKKLMTDIDKLPHGPGWKIYEIQNKDGPHRIKKSYLFCRDIVEVVKEIMANPAFMEYMRYAPEQHYRTSNGQTRVYGNVWTGNWWWNLQMRIPDKFATIIPLIITADRTKLSTMSGGQEAYPVYITVANIDKALRRKTSSQATVLLGYLPVDEFEHASSAEEKERLKNQLTHQAMGILTEPLRKAGEQGVEMLCADGRFRRGYPIVAGMVGDWPKQCMMACTNQFACPRCVQAYKGRGDYPLRARPRTDDETLEALCRYFENKDLGELEDLHLKPWWPWWANLPYVNFANAIMPDVLHQLHQGMIKSHVVRWTRWCVGKPRVDDCFRTMPAAEGMRHFGKGISKLKGQWTGCESREVAKQLLPVAASQPSAWLDPDLTGLARAMLEFSYRAHASRMTDEDIGRLEKALADFHQYKNVIIRKGIFKDNSRFDRIAKLHALAHYVECIREMGTPDNFSTEGPEHLHIECAKKGWRASNKVKPTKQMVVFIQRYEALRIHRAHMNQWLGIDGRRGRRKRSRVVYGKEVEGPLRKGASLAGGDSFGGGEGKGEGEGDAEAEERERRERADEEAEGPLVELDRAGPASEVNEHVVYLEPTQSMALKAKSGVQGLDMAGTHGATDFIPALHAYLNTAKPQENIPTFFFPTAHHFFPVWHRLYLHHKPLPFDPEHPRRDVVRARPESAHLEEAFDVALFIHRPEAFGLHRYRAGRVRVIFSLPKELAWLCPHPLAYVELFTEFSKVITPFVGLNTTSHSLTPEGKRRVAIIPVSDIVAACHLAPQFRRLDEEVSFSAVPDMLSVSRYFFFNHFYNHFIFGLVEHWRVAYQAARDALAA
ncbi:hypothetical protein FRC07_008867 [Ceratobasidium sp. 392]|nr:hypothetical protein FRC07_008867 [Ceratobasidium sp. 392]